MLIKKFKQTHKSIHSPLGLEEGSVRLEEFSERFIKEPFFNRFGASLKRTFGFNGFLGDKTLIVLGPDRGKL